MVGIPVLFIACLGVAAARSIPQLLFWRFMQAIGASPGLTIGTAVIGDIYKLEERGTAFGLFFAVSPCHLIAHSFSISCSSIRLSSLDLHSHR